MGGVFHFPKWTAQSEGGAAKRRQSGCGVSPYHRRLACETLEDRQLLSVTFPSAPHGGPIAAAATVSAAVTSGPTISSVVVAEVTLRTARSNPTNRSKSPGRQAARMPRSLRNPWWSMAR